MKRPFLVCYLLLQIFVVTAQAQEKWDLKECVQFALTNNISIQQQDIQARLAALTHHQSKLSQYPNINFSNTSGLNTGRSIDRTTNQFTTETIFYSGFNLQGNIDVFNFNSKKNTIAANRYEAEAASAFVQKLKNDVSLNVAAAYLQALLNNQQVAISNIQIEQTQAQLTNTRKLVNAGSVPELNALQLEAQLAQDSSNLIAAIGAETQALLYIKALLGMDASFPFAIATPPIELIPLEPLSELQPEYVYQLAVTNLPLQRVNSLRLLAAQKNVAAARGAMFPSVTLGGNLSTNYSNAKNSVELLGSQVTGFNPIGVVKGTTDTVIAPVIVPLFRSFAPGFGRQFMDNFSNGIGINVSVPIFNGAVARTNWQRAKLNEKSYELQQQQDNLTLKQDIYNAYTDAVTALQKFNAASKSVEANLKASEFASKRYNIGLLNTLELITSQSNLYRVRLERLVAQFDYVFKLKVLEFYKGQGLKL